MRLPFSRERMQGGPLLQPMSDESWEEVGSIERSQNKQKYDIWSWE